MSTRAATYSAQVLQRARVSDHLTRLVLGGPGLADFVSTGVPDEWIGLVVPGQFQSRYYTVRAWDGAEMTIDVVMHDVGLVTEWVATDCVGQTCIVTEPKGSFAMPADAAWLIVVGDLTAMPAMARIVTSVDVPVHVWAEVPDDLGDYLPIASDVHWIDQPGDGESRLAEAVEQIEWPEGDGYFWMAGESAQMRAIRKHLMRDRALPSTAYDVMGYWRGVKARQPRAVDPGPIWRAGRAANKSDEEIWADYDAAQES
ncbi:MAG: siderophore-interacting protein [Nocardioides sp.]